MTKQQISRAITYIPYYGLLALLIYMPFHVFLSQSLSLVTGGLDVWKIAKDVVLGLLVLFTICLVLKRQIGDRVFWIITGVGVAYLLLHFAVWAAHTDIYGQSAMLGIVYNSRLPAYLLLGYGAILLTPGKFVFSSVMRVVLAVSTAVALLGILQYVLPKDILTHVGYSLERGARPAFFIDDRPDLPRIMSTLREPNALGAYLLLPVTALTALLCGARKRSRQLLLAGLLGVHMLAIALTNSRSAWLATVLVMGLVVCWQYHQRLSMLVRRFWVPLAAVAVLLLVVGWSQRHSTLYQEYVVHSSPEETVADLDSNDYHWLLIRQGLEGIAHQPFGHGPGTAGLVSIRNPDGGQLTENYYVQIGYEIGVLGVVLLVALQVWLYVRLYHRHDRWGMVLCVSFWGYVLTNMLLHTWSNEAVAAQWWLLAGMGLVPLVAARKRST